MKNPISPTSPLTHMVVTSAVVVLVLAGGVGIYSMTAHAAVEKPIIVNSGTTVRAGTSVDFHGENFGVEEHVRVLTTQGVLVGSGFTNLEGSFTTGSIGVSSTPGTYTYHFVGLTTGKLAHATVTVIP